MRDLFERLDGAKVVVFDDNTGCLLVWFGGHGIHVYSDSSGNDVAFWNTGDFANNNASEAEIRDSIHEHIHAGDYLEIYG